MLPDIPKSDRLALCVECGESKRADEMSLMEPHLCIHCRECWEALMILAEDVDGPWW